MKRIFIISFPKEVFPEKLKMATITPIFIKGNNTLITNYRPIPFLLCFLKLIECIMYNRLYKVFVENNILLQKQFEFQNAHSKKHIILQLLNPVAEAFSQGKRGQGIFIGLSKAVDKVNHVLLQKTQACKIQSENLK